MGDGVGMGVGSGSFHFGCMVAGIVAVMGTCWWIGWLQMVAELSLTIFVACWTTAQI